MKNNILDSSTFPILIRENSYGVIEHFNGAVCVCSGE